MCVLMSGGYATVYTVSGLNYTYATNISLSISSRLIILQISLIQQI